MRSSTISSVATVNSNIFTIQKLCKEAALLKAQIKSLELSSNKDSFKQTQKIISQVVEPFRYVQECEHNKRRTRCEECSKGLHKLCVHKNKSSWCKKCNDGKNLCPHECLKSRCTICSCL
jgi:hypothetical protein